jgi:dihydroorotase (multifunctional complex type)
MPYDLTIRNGKLVTPHATYEGDIAVEGGRIVAIGKSDTLPKGGESIDASSKFVLPGIIDIHVHFREPGYTHKEDFETGSMAAAAGGITTVYDMPNNRPFLKTVKDFDEKREMIRSRAYVDYGLIAAVCKDNIEEIPRLAEAGVGCFKTFMSDVAGETPLDDGELLRAFGLVGKTGLIIGVHAENDDIVKYCTADVRRQGRTDLIAYADAHPNLAEAEAIQRAILLSASAGCRLHIYHMSTREGVELVRDAKARGLHVTSETSPVYLLLSREDVGRVGRLLKVSPPVRFPADIKALWEGLHDGTVDLIGTDHAPHTLEEKLGGDIWESKGGLPGVETNVSLMLTQVNAGWLSLMEYVGLASEHPAKLFNLYPRKGVIQVGSDADFTIVDMEKEGTIREEQLHSKSKMTPFEGYRTKGMPVYTIVRGRTVMREGEIVGRPRGELVRPISR